MAVPIVKFTEEELSKLAKILGIAHWICIIPSLICLFLALNIQLNIEDKIKFIENYNGAVLPGFLVATGFFGFFSHIFNGKVTFSNRRFDKREKWAQLLFPVVILTLIIFLLEFISGIMCFVHVGDLEESFDQGIRVAMAAYKNDAATKEEVDVLQMSYACCGSRSYKDWFFLPWIHPDYKSYAKRFNGKSYYNYMRTNFVNDDVPFSCCNPAVLRPCIHHHVHDDDLHYNYKHKTQLTVYAPGCTDVLIKIYQNSVLYVAGALVLSLSFIQLATAVFGRILQTAIHDSLSNDDEEVTSIGYVFGKHDKDFNETVTTETSEGDPLLDSTVDTYQGTNSQDEELMDESFPPIYENDPPLYEEGDYEVPSMENTPTMTKVKSNHGSYMAMNLSNSSRWMDSANSRPIRHSSPIYRHAYPSPTPSNNNARHVIDINAGMRRHKASPAIRTFTERTSHYSPNKRWSRKPTAQKFTSPSKWRAAGTLRHSYPIRSVINQRSRSSVKTAPLLQFASPFRDKSPLKSAVPGFPNSMSIACTKYNRSRSPSMRRCSPQRAVSPEKRSFKAGVSYGCNHGLLD